MGEEYRMCNKPSGVTSTGCPTKHFLKHFFRQSTSLGVVSGAVIGIEQPAAIGEEVFSGMAEFQSGEFQVVGSGNGIVGDFSQGEKVA